MVGGGTGKGPFDVAEHLRLQQRFGNCRAVDGDKGLILAAATAVNGAGHHLLAGAALPQNHDGGIGRGDPFDHLTDFAHLAALGHDILKTVAGRQRLPQVVALRAQ